MFRWLGHFPTHGWDLWNRTSGEKGCLLVRLEQDPMSENVSKTWGNVFDKRNEMYEANQTRAQDRTLKSSSEI